MRPDFQIPDRARAWVPLAWNAAERAVRTNHNRLVVARLKPGVALKTAQAEMDTISRRLEQQYPEDDRGWGAVVLPLHQDLVGDVRPLLLILLGAVGFVLLIACANVANLVLARTLGRRKDIAVRCALGANRVRLYQQLLSETLILSLSGGAVGFLMAGFGLDGIVAFLGDQLPRVGKVALDGWVLLFTLVISVSTGLLAGIAPAWRLMKESPAGPLKEGIGRTVSAAGDGRTRGALVVSEVALSLVLLVGAGLSIRSLWLLSRVDPGFDPRNVLTLTAMLPRPKYAEPSRQIAFVHQVLERLRALPGVESAGAVDDLPTTGTSAWPIAVEGRPPLPVAQQPAVATCIVAGDYFRSLRVSLKRGRLLTPADDARAPGAVVVSESMARRFWPGEDALGKRLTSAFFPAGPLQVAGIVGDIKQDGLDHLQPVEQMYVAFEQAPTIHIQFTIRSVAGAPALVSAAAAAMRQVDPDQPLLEVKTMDRLLADSLSSRRFTMALLAAFAVLALALAGIGIYSVLAYSVRGRGHEIGVRMALGARTGDVLRLVVSQGMRPAVLGMAIGLAAALALRRILSSLLFGVGASDPVTLAAVAALLARLCRPEPRMRC
jgi:predicted permease